MSKANYNDFKKIISSENFPKIYFFQGDEYLIENAEKMIKNKLLGNNYSDFDLNLYNEENITLEKLISSTETFPIMTKHKLIIIHNLPYEQWDIKEIDDFLKILKDLPEFAYIIISQISKFSNTKNLSKFKKIKKFVENYGITCEFSTTDISLKKQLIQWSSEIYNKNLSDNYAEKIQEICFGKTIKSIKNELQKVCEFEKSNTITESSLKILIKSNSKTNIFELPKTIQLKNLPKSLDILINLLSQGEEPISILSVIASDYIDLFRVKIFNKNGKSISEISDIYNYKNKEFRLKNSLKMCSTIKTNQIKNSLKKLLITDLQLKSNNLDPQLLLSLLTINLVKNKTSHNF